MEYFLAFDNGEDSYIKIPNYVLAIPTDLQGLCDFTMSFVNEGELKEVIFKSLVEYKAFANNSIVILKGNGEYGDVPYGPLKKFFDLSYLEELILQKITIESFRNPFLASFNGISGMGVLCYDLRKAITRYYDYENLRQAVHRFLMKICVANNQIDYEGLYKMVMVICKLLGFSQNESLKCFYKQHNDDVENSDSPLAFEAEWLTRRARLREQGSW